VGVPSSFAAPVTNTATVTSAGTDLNPANNSASYVVAANPVADLAVTKTIVSPTPADPLTAGLPVTWEIVVANNGPSDATGVVETDPVPNTVVGGVSATFGPANTPCGVTGTSVSCDLGSIAAGSSVTTRVTGTVLAS